MAAGISVSKMPPPASPKSNSNNENDHAKNKDPDAIKTTNKKSEPAAAPAPVSTSRNLKKFRPFAPIPPFSRPSDIKDKPDVTCLEGIDIPTEPPKVFVDRQMLSKYQLANSPWPLYTSYTTTVVDKQYTSPFSANLNETPRPAKHEDVLDYVYDWAAWAAEIPDPSRRSEVLQFVMRTLERVLKSGMERTGLTLVPNDVKGARSGTKKTQEGEVNIEVIITSSAKKRLENNIEKLTAQKAKDKAMKDKQAHTDAAATVSLGPTPEELLPIEEASKAPLTRKKRAASEMDQSDVEPDIKRQRAEDGYAKFRTEAETASTADAQIDEQLRTRDKSSSESVTPMSQAEEEKRARYRQQIFQPRLNHILKKAGKVQTRGKCTKWETVRTRLEEAGVGAKYRNLMLRDFLCGYEAWNGDSSIDPNAQLARYAEHGFESALNKASAGNDTKVEAALLPEFEALPALNTDTPIPDAFILAQPHLGPTQPTVADDPAPASSPAPHKTTTLPKKLIVTLRTFHGFDPEDYSAYSEYQHENFMFTFRPTSTVKERVLISDALISQIDAKLDAAAADGSDLDGRNQFVRNEHGKIVATGNFVDLNSDFMVFKGLADPEEPYLFKGRLLGVN